MHPQPHGSPAHDDEQGRVQVWAGRPRTLVSVLEVAEVLIDLDKWLEVALAQLEKRASMQAVFVQGVVATHTRQLYGIHSDEPKAASFQLPNFIPGERMSEHLPWGVPLKPKPSQPASHSLTCRM
jgi:hypothetical protein